MKLIVSPQVKNLGIDVGMAVVSAASVSNKSNVLERHKKEAVEKLQTFDIAASQILHGYKELYQLAGVSGLVPPAEHLLSLIQRNGRLPNINTVVDCYNLVSAATCLSIGAHDLDYIEGDVAFRIMSGSERYVPLGESKPVKVSAGEYACMDDVKILCRLDVKQCNETKITKGTKAFAVYVQGNKYTEITYVQNGLRQVCNLIQEVCGGSYQIFEEFRTSL